MNRAAILICLTPALLAPSCPQTRFLVEMERAPDGGVRRSIRVWIEEDGKEKSVIRALPASRPASRPTTGAVRVDQAAAPETQAARLRRFYGDSIDARGTHSRVFRRGLPADLIDGEFAGFADFGESECPMGRVAVYIERMPGRADMLQTARDAERLVDMVVRASIAYAGMQQDLKSSPQKLERLERFLSSEFRDDILGFLLTGWLTTADSALDDDGGESSNGALAVGAFLLERGYLDTAALGRGDDGFPMELARGVLRKVASVLGHDPTQPLPPFLSRLLDPDELKDALASGLAANGMTTEQFQELALSLLGDWGINLSGTILWKCKARPAITNGTWDAEHGYVFWEASSSDAPNLPKVLRAVWVRPNEAFQSEHFGRIVVRDRLPDYVAWRRSLTDSQIGKWVAFLEGLGPGPGLIDKLEAFRLRANSGPDAEGARDRPDPATEGVDIILSGLRPKSKIGRED